MAWLIDTNVISEIRRGQRCDANVRRWWRGVAAENLFLSALVLGEIRRGIAKATARDPARAATLDAWLADVTTAFNGRILPVDAAVALAWGRITAGRTVPIVDSLLAATAIAHDLTLVTRNVSDVAGLGARLLDPFAASPG